MTMLMMMMMMMMMMRNLKDMLVHTGARPIHKGVDCCNDKRCKCCENLQEKTEFDINGKKHYVKNGGTCNTENEIYGLRCKLCDKWYVGESSLRLRGRLNGHRAATVRLREGKILNSQMNDTGAAEHFAKDGHDFDRDLEMYLLESGSWKSAVERRKEKVITFASFQRWSLGISKEVMGVTVAIPTAPSVFIYLMLK